MPTQDGEKPHVVASNNRANDAVTYSWVHVIWMGTNLARARFAEHVVLAAAAQPLVGFVDCMTLRLVSKRHLVRRVGVLSSGTIKRVDDGIRAALGFGA